MTIRFVIVSSGSIPMARSFDAPNSEAWCQKQVANAEPAQSTTFLGASLFRALLHWQPSRIVQSISDPPRQRWAVRHDRRWSFDALAHRPAGHRLEGLTAELDQVASLMLGQPYMHPIAKQTREHVAVYEPRWIAKHQPPLGRCARHHGTKCRDQFRRRFRELHLE